METPIGNIAGDFEQVELICPRCGSNQVAVCIDSSGYFKVCECHKCGYKKDT